MIRMPHPVCSQLHPLPDCAQTSGFRSALQQVAGDVCLKLRVSPLTSQACVRALSDAVPATAMRLWRNLRLISTRFDCDCLAFTSNRLCRNSPSLMLTSPDSPQKGVRFLALFASKHFRATSSLPCLRRQASKWSLTSHGFSLGLPFSSLTSLFRQNPFSSARKPWRPPWLNRRHSPP